MSVCVCLLKLIHNVPQIYPQRPSDISNLPEEAYITRFETKKVAILCEYDYIKSIPRILLQNGSEISCRNTLRVRLYQKEMDDVFPFWSGSRNTLRVRLYQKLMIPCKHGVSLYCVAILCEYDYIKRLSKKKEYCMWEFAKVAILCEYDYIKRCSTIRKISLLKSSLSQYSASTIISKAVD